MPTAVPVARGALVDLVTRERLDFQFNPEEFELSLGAEWHADTPQGASHAVRSYRGGKGRASPLALIFLRETVDAADMEQLSRRLEALPFPDYDPDGRLRSGPHPVRLHFGLWRSLRCTIGDIKLGYGPWYHPETLRPGGIKAVISLDEAPAAGALSADDVRGGA